VTNKIFVGVPLKTDPLIINAPKTNQDIYCNFQKCFDFTQCSVIKTFQFHISPSSANSNDLLKSIKGETDYSSNKNSACVQLHSVTLTKDTSRLASVINKDITDKPGNHLLIINSDSNTNDADLFCKTVHQLKIPAHVIQILPYLCPTYRAGYDLIMPANLPTQTVNNIWKDLPPILPVQRQYLVSFTYTFLPNSDESFKLLLDNLQRLLMNEAKERDIFIQSKFTEGYYTSCTHGWCFCKDNRQISKKSRFCIIPTYKNNLFLHTNILETLAAACVPVFIGDRSLLPFTNTLDWKTASVVLHYQRLPELIYLLRSLPTEDFISLKRNGRFFYQTYFASQYKYLRTIISNIQTNIGLHPTLHKDHKAMTIKTIGNAALSNTPQHYFSHNLSTIGVDKHRLWNTYPGALHTIPVNPFQTPLPSEYQFTVEGADNYSPIGDGKGGDGIPFARSLGGDYPVEQFTVLMLTYDREVILMEALQRLSGMKYLHKVVVVWNNPKDPSDTLVWPDIDVKIEVIRAGKNSLNNRFIPYDVIETEAVLSMDDDIYLRHDEIELAFRIWRENRDRLVGFPGRHHAFNSTSNYFYYNSEHSCELSLVLTGGAFFHKYYSYVYTNIMENAIKEMVDNFMNCEDIAMNFLVAHITQKPPIKVTSRWTFRCPGCPVALSADVDHYRERDTCMMYFQKVYGYNPLKRTQFRADSVLFKTRIPSTMTKCFQYV